MNRLRVLTLALGVLASVTSAKATATAEQIEVRLFLAHTGTFSEPLPQGATLWNTVIGEGDLREPSSSTLVKVMVSAGPRTYDMKAKVELTVRAKGSRWKNTQVKALGVFGSDGRQYVAFWLPETGCEELLLEAAVRGTKKVLKHTIPFRCGE